MDNWHAWCYFGLYLNGFQPYKRWLSSKQSINQESKKTHFTVADMVGLAKACQITSYIAAYYIFLRKVYIAHYIAIASYIS